MSINAERRFPPAEIHIAVHGLRVRIEGDWAEVVDAVCQDFSWFETALASEAVDVTVAIGQRAPDLTRYGSIPQTFITKRNVVFQQESKTIVDYSGRVLAVYDREADHLQVEGEDAQLVHEAASLFLLSRLGRHIDQSRKMRLHALGLSGQRGAVLVLLASGGGKTTLALRALRAPG